MGIAERWYLVHAKGLVVRRDAAGGALPATAEVAALGLDLATAEQTGTGRALAVVEGAALPESLAVMSLRDVFSAHGEELFLQAGIATQILDWVATSRYCGRCATPTERLAGERCIRCPACGLSVFPRIAPAAIVLVRRGEEALLARGKQFPLPFFSALAGFVEIGETLEQCVAREVREEVGLEVKHVHYFGSQPWPFPHSLMVGVTAEWASGDVRPDPSEIVDAQWFRADALPMIPPRVSIARRLIDAWLDEVRSV
jgi:NAD+ diphosphatase